MILIHIVTDKKDQAEDIAEFLISKKLLVEVLIMDGIKRKLAKQKSATMQPHYLILGKSKALLFDNIDKSLREKYGSKMPELYSLPIVHMDWDQAHELKEGITKV